MLLLLLLVRKSPTNPATGSFAELASLSLWITAINRLLRKVQGELKRIRTKHPNGYADNRYSPESGRGKKTKRIKVGNIYCVVFYDYSC